VDDRQQCVDTPCKHIISVQVLSDTVAQDVKVLAQDARQKAKALTEEAEEVRLRACLEEIMTNVSVLLTVIRCTDHPCSSRSECRHPLVQDHGM
jgi:hypothetical protein